MFNFEMYSYDLSTTNYGKVSNLQAISITWLVVIILLICCHFHYGSSILSNSVLIDNFFYYPLL